MAPPVEVATVTTIAGHKARVAVSFSPYSYETLCEYGDMQCIIDRCAAQHRHTHFTVIFADPIYQKVERILVPAFNFSVSVMQLLGANSCLDVAQRGISLATTHACAEGSAEGSAEWTMVTLTEQAAEGMPWTTLTGSGETAIEEGGSEEGGSEEGGSEEGGSEEGGSEEGGEYCCTWPGPAVLYPSVRSRGALKSDLDVLKRSVRFNDVAAPTHCSL